MLTTACQGKRQNSKLFIMIINICKRKAWRKRHQSIRPGYFFEWWSPFGLLFLFSYCSLCFCHFNNNLYTGCLNVPAFSQVKTDWQIVKHKLWTFSPWEAPARTLTKQRLLLGYNTFLLLERVEALAWRRLSSWAAHDSQALDPPFWTGMGRGRWICKCAQVGDRESWNSCCIGSHVMK